VTARPVVHNTIEGTDIDKEKKNYDYIKYMEPLEGQGEQIYLFNMTT
jgi:hypothetical protein